jgi:hypothetical protein
MSEHQITMVSLGELVSEDHQYRRFKKLFYTDKRYCTSPAKIAARVKVVHLGAIKKNNMNGKNFDLDKYYTSLRSPFKRLFFKDNKRLPYGGIAKNQFVEFMNAICFNLRRLTILAG